MAEIVIEEAGSYHCDDDDTILRAALRVGIAFPYSCNTGSCGTCRFHLLDGQVEHLRTDPPAWSDRDRSRGRWLGCQARPLEDCRVRVRLDDEIPPHPPLQRDARLVGAVDLTHDMREFHFEVEEPDAFLPGQYALLELEGVDGARAYSMSNLAGSREWQFVIKHVPGGAATSILFNEMRLGDTVRVDGPYGLAYLRETGGRDLLLVAGGSGLSPMLSIAKAAANSSEDRHIYFFYGGRRPADLCAEPLLDDLPGLAERLTVVSAVSEVSEGWEGPLGLIHEVVRANMGQRLSDVEVYFAGPPLMTEAMQLMLRESGVELEHMHFDEFF
ncbi:MAG: 2Fe-2S iron-sulfur cluster-binding protein [Acidimicrobiia bacterium]